jgi:hypothetical protein
MPFVRYNIEAVGVGSGRDDLPVAKKGKSELLGVCPMLTRSEVLTFEAVLALFTAGIFCVFLTTP